MDTTGKELSKTGEEGIEQSKPEPRCLAVFQKGIRTGRDFANGMAALMSDIIDGRVTPAVGNAACNAGGKLLKVVEMEQKYGRTGAAQGKTLTLSDGTEETH